MVTSPPKPTRSELILKRTNDVARDIIESETDARREKSERLRKQRLAQDSAKATVEGADKE